jgi:hypothetical protein
MTSRKNYVYRADTATLRTEWVKYINAAVFKARSVHHDVRVVIPFDHIKQLSVVKNTTNDDCLKVYLVDCENFIQGDEVSYF